MIRSNRQKVTWILAVSGLCLLALIANSYAQAPNQSPTEVHHHYYYGSPPSPGYSPGYPGSYQPGYPPPSYGAPSYGMSGMTNPSAARGEYNLYTAQAAQVMSQTRQQSIENHNFAVQSMQQNVMAGQQFQDYERSRTSKPLTGEEAHRLALQLEPGRLSSAQIDRSANIIHWPPILRDKQFSETRYKIDQLYHQRTPANSGEASDNYGQIERACDAMQSKLHDQIDQMPAESYMVCYHFIKSLAYEARFAVLPPYSQVAAK